MIAQSFDYVVTICNKANERCPVFPGKARRVHHAFDNPVELKRLAKTEEEVVFHYRRMRDEIRQFVEYMPGSLESKLKPGVA